MCLRIWLFLYFSGIFSTPLSVPNSIIIGSISISDISVQSSRLTHCDDTTYLHPGNTKLQTYTNKLEIRHKILWMSQFLMDMCAICTVSLCTYILLVYVNGIQFPSQCYQLFYHHSQWHWCTVFKTHAPLLLHLHACMQDKGGLEAYSSRKFLESRYSEVVSEYCIQFLAVHIHICLVLFPGPAQLSIACMYCYIIIWTWESL